MLIDELKVGDPVTSILFGMGKVVEINLGQAYSIVAEFAYGRQYFTVDGYLLYKANGQRRDLTKGHREVEVTYTDVRPPEPEASHGTLLWIKAAAGWKPRHLSDWVWCDEKCAWQPRIYTNGISPEVAAASPGQGFLLTWDWGWSLDAPEED